MREKNNWKRISSLLLVITLFLQVMVACSDSAEKKNTLSSKEIMTHIWAACPMDYEEIVYIGDKKNYNESILNFYGFDEDVIESIKDYAIMRPTGTVADEYLIFRTSDVDAVKQVLEDYREQRLNDFTGYAPTEEDKLKQSKILSAGNCVAYLVGSDYKKLKSLFEAATEEDFKLSSSEKGQCKVLESMASTSGNGGTEVDWENPETFPDGPYPGTKVDQNGVVLFPEDEKYMTIYDSSKIVEAYKSNDSSILEEEKAYDILAYAKQVISQYITEDMSVYEKEKAIHDYIVANAENDDMALKYSTWYQEDSDNPYGCLINKQAVCYGYTTTFKMFMDMLDIECQIVKGFAYSKDGMHAWNLVKLDDGCWYAVDVTWDDPSFYEGTYYNFFNVNDKTLEQNSHMWNKKDWPAATGGKYSGLEKPVF